MTTSELIGVFDSGVGGLTVAERLQEALPALSFIYYGDTAHVPYGDREAKEVVGLIDKICRHLLQSGAQALVMACNTSSALAYEHVLSWSPRPVIGIIAEAAEAAAQATREGKVGIMANPLTAASGAYERETGNVIVETFRLRNLDPMQVPAALVYSREPARVTMPSAM